MKIDLIWLREDLRIQDHPGFFEVDKSGNKKIVIYFLTESTWVDDHHRSDRQIDLIFARLNFLKKNLHVAGVPLLIFKADRFEKIPMLLASFCEQNERAGLKISHIFLTKNYGVDEQKRDQACFDLFKNKKLDIQFKIFEDYCLIPPDRILKPDGRPYQVFTAYKNQWLRLFFLGQNGFFERYESSLRAQPEVKKIILIPEITSGEIYLKNQAEKIKLDLNFPIEDNLIDQRLDNFVQEKIKNYHVARDFPSESGTSLLSTYLALGMISPRKIIHKIQDVYKNKLDQAGVMTYLNELIWRDFYQMILKHFPRVSRHCAFKTSTESIPWRKDKRLFKAWCDGVTGFPIVDAAMRCLNQTGFLHNRLRMVVAMFLSKILLIDWRWGERYFMQNLIDGELGANNGGWQWCASTGTDAVPYFRIFNPTLQSEKFDPEGVFIAKYIPELRSLIFSKDKKQIKKIHAPNASLRLKLGYPSPIVDYKAQRALALEWFSAV